MVYLLAVDGGATKTAVSLRNENGSYLYESVTKGTNYHVIGADEFKKRLVEVLEELKGRSLDVAVFALAGIDTEEDQRIVFGLVVEVLSSLGIKVGKLFVENDGYSTLVGLTGKNPGALVISGTGSIAFAQGEDGSVIRCGGWGHRTGDEGSGYYIGREIVRAVVRMNDGRGPDTVLQDLVYQQLGIRTIDELMQWLYGHSYSPEDLAGLSVLIGKAVELGDLVAERILEETVKEIGILAETVIGKSGLTGVACNVYLNGGTVRNNVELFERLKSRIETSYSGKEVVLCTEAPIEYIYLRALTELK